MLAGSDPKHRQQSRASIASRPSELLAFDRQKPQIETFSKSIKFFPVLLQKIGVKVNQTSQAPRRNLSG